MNVTRQAVMSKMTFSPFDPHHHRGQFDIVAIVSSAGGLAAVRHVLEHLPVDFPASIVIVQHLDPRHRSLMAGILSRHTQLTVKEAEEGDRLVPGHVRLAPPDRHLLVNPDRSLSCRNRSWCIFFGLREICCLNPWRQATKTAPLPSF